MSTNPTVERLSRPRHGQKSERRVAKKMRARLTPGSGNIAGAGGDCVLPELLIECKSTVHDSLSLKKEWLEKITREALARNRAPAVTLSFVDANGQARGSDWIAIPHWLAVRVGLVSAPTHNTPLK